MSEGSLTQATETNQNYDSQFIWSMILGGSAWITIIFFWFYFSRKLKDCMDQNYPLKQNLMQDDLEKGTNSNRFNDQEIDIPVIAPDQKYQSLEGIRKQITDLETKQSTTEQAVSQLQNYPNQQKLFGQLKQEIDQLISDNKSQHSSIVTNFEQFKSLINSQIQEMNERSTMVEQFKQYYEQRLTALETQKIESQKGNPQNYPELDPQKQIVIEDSKLNKIIQDQITPFSQRIGNLESKNQTEHNQLNSNILVLKSTLEQRMEKLENKNNTEHTNLNDYIKRLEQRIEILQNQNQTQLNEIVKEFEQKIENFKNTNQTGDTKLKEIIKELEQRIENFKNTNQTDHNQLNQNIQLSKIMLEEQIHSIKQNISDSLNQQNQKEKEVKQLQQNENSQNLEQLNQQDLKKQMDKLQSSLIEFGKQISSKIENLITDFQKKVRESHQKIQQTILQEKRLISKDKERAQLSFNHIEQLYELSIRKRHVEQTYQYFVRDLENEQALQKNYSIRSSNSKASLKVICDSFRQARGDGNCFYTSFGFQFLLILLKNYSDKQFQEFISRMKNLNLPMKINYQGIKIDDQNIEEKLLQEFLYRLEILRMIPDLNEREQTFIKHFAAFEKCDEEIDGVFYGLSTIFFRNLANLVVESSEMKAALFDRENLLKWEEECNSNEVVIESLSVYLKIHVQLILFDNGGFKQNEYGKEFKDRIILLIKPGHYNIGIKQQSDSNIQVGVSQDLQDQQQLQLQNQEDTLLFDKYMIHTISRFAEIFQPIYNQLVEKIMNQEQNEY